MDKSSGRRILVLGLAFAALAFIAFQWLQPLDGVQPSTKDLFFSFTAGNLRDPEFCERINPKAVLTAGFASPGHKVSRLRSECYLEVASKTSRADLCAKVQPATGWLGEGRAVNRSYCKDHIGDYGKPTDSPIVLDDHISYLEEAGYTLAKLQKFADELRARRTLDAKRKAGAQRREQIFSIYDKVRMEPDFLAKVEQLPLSASNEDFHSATSEERLVYFVGADNALAEMCERLSSLSYFEEPGLPLFLRNDCFQVVAVKKHDPTLCDRIQPDSRSVPGFPAGYNMDFAKADYCRYLVALPSVGVGGGSRIYPMHGEETLEQILPKLGVSIPLESAQAPGAIKEPTNLDIYDRFYRYIVREASDEERTEFIQNLKRLR